MCASLRLRIIMKSTIINSYRLFSSVIHPASLPESVPGALSVEPVRGGPRTLSKPPPKADESCGTLPAEDDDLSDPVQMIDPKTREWGGPTKGGTAPEPTRFGDWERKGRCSESRARYSFLCVFCQA